MGASAILLAAAAVVALWLAPGGMYWALGLSILAVGLGWRGYRQRSAPGPMRLCGAAAVTVGGIALLLAAAKVVLTSLAIDAIDGLL